MTPRAPLLTAEMARELARLHQVRPDNSRERLEALATGRTVCAPVQTEAECRAEYEKTWGPQSGSFRGDHWSGWLASRRAAGLVAEKKEG